jgi:hypothetical protein
METGKNKDGVEENPQSPSMKREAGRNGIPEGGPVGLGLGEGKGERRSPVVDKVTKRVVEEAEALNVRLAEAVRSLRARKEESDVSSRSTTCSGKEPVLTVVAYPRAAGRARRSSSLAYHRARKGGRRPVSPVPPFHPTTARKAGT